MNVRRNSRYALALSAALVVIIVSSCGDKSNPVSAQPSIVGTWNLTTLISGDISIAAGTTTMTDVETYNSDHTCKQIMVNYLASPVTTDTSLVTWITNGDKLLVTSPGATAPDTAVYGISGNTLTLTTTVIDSTSGTSQSITMKFARQ
jgi:hypothetical protein